MKKPHIPRYRVKLRSRYAQKQRGRKKKPLDERVGHKCIRALKCYEDVYAMLCSGYPIGEVARFIREDKGEAQAIKRSNLESYIRDIRKEIPDADLIAIRPTSHVHKRALERMMDGLNVLEELEKLYRVQSARIAIDVKNEENINKLMRGMSNEVKECRSILLAYHQVQSDLGLVKKHLGKLEVDHTSTSLSVSATMGDAIDQEALDAVAGTPKRMNNVLKVFHNMQRLSAIPEEDEDDPIDVTPEFPMDPGEPGFPGEPGMTGDVS